MLGTESPYNEEAFARAIGRARGYLDVPVKPRRAWPVLVAATAFAVSSLLFATAAVMSPSVTLTHPPRSASGAVSFGPPLDGAVN